MKKLAIQSVEATVMVCVGVGLGGFVLYRVARGAWRVAREAFVEFVSG